MAALKAIVKLCVKNGITSLKWGALELDFGEQIKQNGEQVSLSPQRGQTVKAITEKQHKEQTTRSIEDEELLLREQQFAELQLTDPLAAEEMIVNGELSDTTGDDDESEHDD